MDVTALSWPVTEFAIADERGLPCRGGCDAMFRTVDATRPALVGTLTHLPLQWEREIKKFAPELRVHIIQKGTPYEVAESEWEMWIAEALSEGSSEFQPGWPHVQVQGSPHDRPLAGR